MKPIKVIFWDCPQQNVKDRPNMCGYYSVYNLISMQNALSNNRVPNFTSTAVIEANIPRQRDNELDANEVDAFYDSVAPVTLSNDNLITLKAAVPAQYDLDFFQYFIQLCALKTREVDVADVAHDTAMGKAELLITTKYDFSKGEQEIIPPVFCYSQPDSILFVEDKMKLAACRMKDTDWLKKYGTAFLTETKLDVIIANLNAGKAYGFISFFPAKDGPLGHWQSVVLYLGASGSIVLQIADSLTHLPRNEEEVLAKISPVVWKLCAALQHYPIMFGSVIRDFVLPKAILPVRTKLGVNLQEGNAYFPAVVPDASQAFSISFPNIFENVMHAEITIARNSLGLFEGGIGPVTEEWHNIVGFLPETLRLVENVVKEENNLVLGSAANVASFSRSLSGGLKRTRIAGGAGRALTPPIDVSGSPSGGTVRGLKASGGAGRPKFVSGVDQVFAVHAVTQSQHPNNAPT